MTMERWETARLTRRDLLKRAGVVGVTLGIGPSLLAACGGGGGGGGGGVAGTIDFLTWQGYDLQGDKDFVKWEGDSGINFNATFINTHEDIQAKVTQSPGTYNMITYYEGYWELYKKLNVLSPLDADKVPLYEKNYDVFKHQKWWESDGKLWGIPWTWGSWVIVYNPDQIPKLTSYQDLLSPKLKGKVAIMDDPNCAMLVGARALGYEPPDLTKDQVNSIIDFYREIRKNARTLASSMGDLTNLYTSGEVVASIPVVNTLEGLIKQAGGSAVSTVPKEGSATFADAWAIPPDTKDIDTAYAWINQTLTPEVQAYAGESLTQGVTQPDAVPLLSAATREIFPYDKIDAWLESAPLYSLPKEDDPNIVNFQGWLDAWAAFKAEGS